LLQRWSIDHVTAWTTVVDLPGRVNGQYTIDHRSSDGRSITSLPELRWEEVAMEDAPDASMDAI
jgi:hypothetical protein